MTEFVTLRPELFTAEAEEDPQIHAKRAYAVLDHIRENPADWNQKLWISLPAGTTRPSSHGPGEIIPATDAPCGTRGCFAGILCLMAGDKLPWSDLYWYPTNLGPSFAQLRTTDNPYGVRHVGQRASELLGESGERDLGYLFDGTNDFDDLERAVKEIFGGRPDSSV